MNKLSRLGHLLRRIIKLIFAILFTAGIPGFLAYWLRENFFEATYTFWSIWDAFAPFVAAFSVVGLFGGLNAATRDEPEPPEKKKGTAHLFIDRPMSRSEGQDLLYLSISALSFAIGSWLQVWYGAP